MIFYLCKKTKTEIFKKPVFFRCEQIMQRKSLIVIPQKVIINCCNSIVNENFLGIKANE